MDEEKTLIAAEKYLKTGAHIGTKFKTCDMKRYIYKRRSDGLMVMDIKTLNERIALSAKFIAMYPKERVVVVSRKLYGKSAVNEFADSIGGMAITGRFVPGTFTNPEGKEFIEAKLLIATEPDADRQAIEEAVKLKIPIVALCSTNNTTRNIDLIVPINNKGRKSLALAYWLLAREVLKERKEIKSDNEFTKKVEEFEYQLKEIREESLQEKRKEMSRVPEKRGRGNRNQGRKGKGSGRRKRR